MPEVSVSLSSIQLSMSVVVTGLLLATGVLVNAIAEEIASPLKVAQCRAACVHVFTSRNDSQKMCLQNSDCFTCWENCQLLQTNFLVWEHICSQKATCFSGCETACRFMNKDKGTQVLPVLVHKGEEVLRIIGQETRWPAPESSLDGPWVYLVMRKLNNVWGQITQTLDLSAKIPYGGTVRVLVVGKNGLLTIYSPSTELPSPRETARDVIQSLGEDALLRLGLPAPEPDVFRHRPNDGRWNLREVSLIHQQVMVIAEVAWEPRHSRALYLVTWEVDGGGIQGNLFTDTTTVTLSLWPDTLFHIQVEMVGGQRSEELLIDTRRETIPILQESITTMGFELTFGATTAIILAFCFLIFVWRIKHNQKLIRYNIYENNIPRGLSPIITVMKLPSHGNKIKNSYVNSSQLLYEKGQLLT